MSKLILGVLLVACSSAAQADAASCGTVAAPTACSITVGGTVTYSFTGFSLLSASGTGNVYTAADISIDLASGGALTALLTFSKNAGGPTPGIVFFVNPGETSGFTFSYSASISAAGSGTVVYGSPFIVDMNATRTNNAIGAAQLVVSPASCQAVVGVGQGVCTIPGGQPPTITPGNIVTMAGNTGNVGIVGITNLLTADFTSPVELLDFAIE